MIARTEIDKCFSTALNGHGAFNFDNEERTELSPELARSALDFTIGVKKCYDDMGREIPSLRHLQDNEGHFIPCHGVTDSFHPIQHVDVFDYIVNDVMPKVPELELEMAGTIRGRSTGVFAAKFGDTFSIKGDNSEHNLRLFFSNPNNGTGSLIMGFTHVRVICQNTLRAAINEAKHDGFKVHHTAGGQLVAEGILNTIAAQAQAAIEMKARCERLAEIQVDAATVERVLDSIYPMFNLPEDSFAYARMKNLREGVLKQFESGDTAQSMTKEGKGSAWALFNSFTFPIFNPEEKRLAKSKTKDRAEIAYTGMAGGVADKVENIFRKVERVAVYA